MGINKTVAASDGTGSQELQWVKNLHRVHIRTVSQLNI